MARLRIAQAIEQHEKDAWIPVYLVPDANALINKLHILKHLVGAERFVIVIATVVLGTLDRMKKESAGAREAIRWIERCIHVGNKYLRTQTTNETIDLTIVDDANMEQRRQLEPLSELIDTF